MLNWPGQNQTLSRHEGFRRAIPGTSAENVTMVIMACTCPVFLHMLLGFSSTSLLQFTPIFLHKYLGFIVIFLHQAALSTTAVRSFANSDPDSKDDIRCLLLEAVNYNGLLFFLVANLLTGLVNLAIDTKLYSSGGAFFVLTVYMFMLSATSLILYKNKISFKAIIFQKLLRLY
ncbi:GWT1-like protein [Mya arenaria]|uniref:GWT1-like protein n=1 Tax=Mya arenaria TaxID=6604 RepID=A0ABY7EBW1_MYAAR|nr:GWT1-like protein [Mya arenaria]